MKYTPTNTIKPEGHLYESVVELKELVASLQGPETSEIASMFASNLKIYNSLLDKTM
jgi:hypothetical protein